MSDITDKIKRRRIENAVISGYSIGYGDHGIFTMSVNFRGDNWAQSFGDYSLGYLEDWTKEPNYALWFIANVLKVVGVADVTQLIDAPVRIKRKDGKIYAVGNYLKDRWFIPSNDIKRYNNSKAEQQ